MADFQTKINRYPGVGLPGAFASINPVVSTALGRIADGEVGIGGFCFDSADEGKVSAAGTTKPLGFVARNVIYPINDVTVGEQNFVPDGKPVNVQIQGDFYVQVKEAATKGQRVFASTADGSVIAGEAGATVADAVETDWVFASSADAGEIAIISNYGQAPAVSGGAGGAAVTPKPVTVVTDVTAADDTISVTKDTINAL